MSAFVTAGAGFLIAVLWFDLMFDVQVLGSRRGELPEPVLASIAAYYARVTTTARPMNRLVAATMLAMLCAIVLEIADDDPARWIGWSSLALALPAVGLAGARIVPAAVRLGTRSDDLAAQSTAARAIFREHVFCFAAIASVLVLQLAFG